jgi:hypothetical protein
MTESNSPSEPAPSSHPEWIDAPSQIVHIEQVSHHGDVTSFEAKGDPLHDHILALVWEDRVADMSASSRRGLANNIHFLLLRDMYDATATGKIVAEHIGLLNLFAPSNKRHRVQIVVRGAESVDGGWVQKPDQALDGLRRVVDGKIYDN